MAKILLTTSLRLMSCACICCLRLNASNCRVKLAARFALTATCISDSFASLRSEEHTSELQSQSNLVCRLLLEKKKKKNRPSLPVNGIMIDNTNVYDMGFK